MKIGDELIFAKSGLAESYVEEGDVDDLISKIENGEAYNRYGQKWCLGDMNEIWFVNGKKYHRDDIIIPAHSGEANEMIQQQEFEEITPENWNEVWHRSKQDVTASSCITTINKGGGNWCAELNHEQIKTKDFAEFLAFIQNRVTLKPLPKFDFRQYLLDNGFKTSLEDENLLMSKGITTRYIVVAIPPNDKYFYFCGDAYLKTKENADILIEIAKLAEGLK